MDGNGRWANRRGLPRTAGHEAGEAALLDVVAGALEIGVSHLSAYAFSTENWKRSPEEVRFLMGFSRRVLRRQRDTLNARSEEHTSELQSRGHLVCRLLLEKK